MKKTFFLVCLLLSLTAGHSQKFTFTLYSQQLGGQATLKHALNGFGCKGQNISPDLYWKNPPEGTKGFAVTIHDQSAPTGSGWWHWIIYNIDKTVLELKSDAGDVQKNIAPANSVQSKTDFGTKGYGGPCPPVGSGIHRYVITVYALKTETLDLDPEASPAFVSYNLEANTIEKSSLIFYYKN
jgi:Raf kinase inhibitor-like YbhB/YbcL family protein